MFFMSHEFFKTSEIPEGGTPKVSRRELLKKAGMAATGLVVSGSVLKKVPEMNMPLRLKEVKDASISLVEKLDKEIGVLRERFPDKWRDMIGERIQHGAFIFFQRMNEKSRNKKVDLQAILGGMVGVTVGIIKEAAMGSEIALESFNRILNTGGVGGVLAWVPAKLEGKLKDPIEAGTRYDIHQLGLPALLITTKNTGLVHYSEEYQSNYRFQGKMILSVIEQNKRKLESLGFNGKIEQWGAGTYIYILGIQAFSRKLIDK